MEWPISSEFPQNSRFLDEGFSGPQKTTEGLFS